MKMSYVSSSGALRQLSWLSSRGVCVSGVKHYELHGVGLAAATSAVAGEVLLSVPRQIWWPLSAAAAREALPTARIDAYAASLGAGPAFSDAALLAAHLAKHRLTPASELAPFLADLPNPDLPLMWPPALRAVLLRGTSAGPAAESQAALSDGAYAALAADAADSAAPPPPEASAFKWAQCILLSRGHSGDGKPLALIPGLDLINHGGESASALVRHVAGAFELVATRPLSVGDPIEINYGSHASHRLMRLYGFVPSDGDGGGGRGGAASARAGDEVLLRLLPSPSELEGAPQETIAEVEAQRAALATFGLPSGQLRLVVDSEGRVPLPIENAGAASSSVAHVLLAAIEAQRRRVHEGLQACEAVQATTGTRVADEAARARAALSAQLHQNESVVLEAARETISAGL